MAKNKNKKASVPAGGPSNINGVLYQLIWALATLGGFRASGQKLVGGVLDQITLVLEPTTGGDQQIVSKGKKVVTQIKARSTGDTWSLQEVISNVLPDLYLAVDESQPGTTFQFVTEGRRGDWSEAEQFFLSLPPLPVSSDLLLELSDDPADGIRYQAQKSQVDTPRTLFRRIVDSLRQKEPISLEPYQETCGKTWLLLRGFRFEAGYSHDTIRKEIDTWLLARISSADQLDRVRDNLLLDLGRQACSGDAVVDRQQFFGSKGLDGIPLTDWFGLTEKARQYLLGAFRRKTLDVSEDTRPTLTGRLFGLWTTNRPILVLCGESGTGKTWHGYQLLTTALQNGAVALLVDSRRDADKDLAAAAKVLWHSVAGRDESPPLERLRARLRQIDPNNEQKQLVLLVDNVGDIEEAKRLLEANWEEWGVRVAITCQQHVADAIRPYLENRGEIVTIDDFSTSELQDYLSHVVRIDWARIPFDQLKVLRRPLLASIFRTIVSDDGWSPKNEYEVFERFWDSFPHRNIGPMELEAIRQLAVKVLLDGSRYPWTVSDLRDGGLDSTALQRLVTVGALRETSQETFEVSHDRLLNWFVAESIASRLRDDSASVDVVIPAVAALLADPVAKCGRFLSYVPMDVLFLIADPNAAQPQLAQKLVTAFETVLDWRAFDVFYKELLPTLGERSIPIAAERMRTVAEEGPSYRLNRIIAGMVATGEKSLDALGRGLLDDPSPKVRRAGLRLLALRPVTGVMDRLWEIHTEGVATPNVYQIEPDNRFSLYEDTFRALKACVRLDQPWLSAAISKADAAREPIHDLAYLVANVGDEALWLGSKAALIAKVDAKHPRSLATCIQVFRDAAEKEWLQKNVGNKIDLVQPRCTSRIGDDRPHSGVGNAR